MLLPTRSPASSSKLGLALDNQPAGSIPVPPDSSAAGAKIFSKPELLAPAGGWEQLQFAIRFGADAVYLAADRFGMRARAENFSLADIPSVVAYAHERDVKVHITVNTQMYERDLPALEEYLHALGQADVDAFIIGDLGAFALAKEQAPNVEVHVSTQASISNTRAALTWYNLGAKRIVCAREMSLSDIAAMRAVLPADLEIEAFVHGSMCMAVSGRCLISDYMTDRSGVAGNCAQPCRWKYALMEETRPGQYFPVEEDGRGSYIMNAKDLCMLEHLDELREAGVDSIKIEGRNKKAFYVATVVNAYRQVLDGASPADFLGELDTVSHRPYCTGFYFGPAHQTPQDDRYTRNYSWVFECTADDAASCGTKLVEPGDESFVVTGLCRNRFAEGDELEVLSPHEPVRTVFVRDLHYVGVDPNHPGFPPAADVVPGPVQVANRTMELYSFTIPFEAQPHDIFRIKAQ